MQNFNFIKETQNEFNNSVNEIYNNTFCKNLIDYNTFNNLIKKLLSALNSFTVKNKIDLFHNKSIIENVHKIVLDFEIDNLVNIYIISNYLLLNDNYFNKLSDVLISYFNIYDEEYIIYSDQFKIILDTYYKNEVFPEIKFITHNTSIFSNSSKNEKNGIKNQINKSSKFIKSIESTFGKQEYYPNNFNEINYEYLNMDLILIALNKFNPVDNFYFWYSNKYYSTIEYNEVNAKRLLYLKIAGICDNFDLVKKIIDYYNLENKEFHSNDLEVNKYFTKEIKEYLLEHQVYRPSWWNGYGSGLMQLLAYGESDIHFVENNRELEILKVVIKHKLIQ